MAGEGSGMKGGPAQAGGSGGAAGPGIGAWAAFAPEAVGQAAAGPLGGLVVAVCLEAGVGEEPRDAAPRWSLEKELGVEARPGAGVAVAVGPEHRGL